MGKFEDLLDLLLADDDDEEDVGVEVHIITDGPDEEQEEPKGKHEERKPSKTEDEELEEEVEELREKAKKQHAEIVEKVGKKKADQVVDLAAHCAMISGLLRDTSPLDQDMVDEYTAICKEVYPERSTPLMKAIAYMAMRKMAKEGIDSLC